MNVSLTSELDRFVTEKVESGLYTSNSEVVREALRLLRHRDRLRRRRLLGPGGRWGTKGGGARGAVTLGELRQRRDEILMIARRHGAVDVRVFGSVVRDEAGAASDVDFLVEMEAGHSLLERAGLLVDLQDALGCEVDVATESSLRDRVRDRVLEEAVPL
jgi:predicted nucleotidyltransferase